MSWRTKRAQLVIDGVVRYGIVLLLGYYIGWINASNRVTWMDWGMIWVLSLNALVGAALRFRQSRREYREFCDEMKRTAEEIRARHEERE